jgi:hypothetical protein
MLLTGDQQTGSATPTINMVNSRFAWRKRSYPVPQPSKAVLRWKASALRGFRRWTRQAQVPDPIAIVIPALYNLLPGETVAMGWLDEIDALGTIRQRLSSASRLTGWDVFTFHTLHNLDHFYDSMIATVRDTWVREGNLSAHAVTEARRRFPNSCDYYRIEARLVENLVFQSSLMEYLTRRAKDLPMRYHVIGTALYSALVWSGSISFTAAVDSAVRVGNRWGAAIGAVAEERAARSGQSANERQPGWEQFQLTERLIRGREHISLAVAREDLPKPEAPVRPFWFSAAANGEPTRIETVHDAELALESLNLDSWSCKARNVARGRIRGWLVSPLHPMARSCRWSFSNHLLATPHAMNMFLEHIATIGSGPVLVSELEADQKRLRLSRMKVTGP